jgi:hypothetical protein
MTEFLANLDPMLFYTAVSAATGLLIYLWRKISYASWDAVTRRNPLLQNLPALVLAGLMSAAPALGKPFWPALGTIVFGILFGGGTAIFSHHALKDSPLPYTGGAPALFPRVSPDAPSEANTPAETPKSKTATGQMKVTP